MFSFGRDQSTLKSHKFLRTLAGGEGGEEKKKERKSYKVTKGQQKYNLKIDTIEKKPGSSPRDQRRESA